LIHYLNISQQHRSLFLLTHIYTFRLGQEHTGEQTLTIPIKQPEDILPFLHPTTTKLK